MKSSASKTGEFEPVPPGAVARSLGAIAAENATLVNSMVNDAEIVRCLDLAALALAAADRVFLVGAGRSGIALRATAMRLMHVGLDVFVVGDVTTPAIRSGDVLLVASGSGSTAGIVRSATTAKSSGAVIVALTSVATSALASLADVLITVDAAAKMDRDGAKSAQYAGSLFEQLVLTIGDSLFDALWHVSGRSADELWPRHSNLE